MPTEENKLPSIHSLFLMTLEKYIGDNIPRHATVLTFSALFAVAPIIVLATKIMGLIYGPQMAEGLIHTQVENFLDSPGVATLVQTLIDNTLPPSASWWIIAGFGVVLLYCMGSFFVELKVVLNHIWGGAVDPDEGIWEFINARLRGTFMGLIGGLLLFCGLFLITQFTLVTEWLFYLLNLGTGYEYWSYTIFLFLMLTTLFALTYQFVPNVKIVWQNVLLGASATAILFSVSRLLLLQYFSYSYLNTMFGATSAVVIILLWAYYSVSIFLLGAEFTYVYSQTYGRGWREASSLTEERSIDEALGIGTTLQYKVLKEVPFSAAFNAPERIEFLEDFGQLAEMPAPVKENEPEVDVSPEDVVEKRSWLSRVIRREKKSQPIVTVKHVKIAEERPKRRFNPITKIRQRIQATRSRFMQIMAFPLRVIRPVREIVLAVSVIGAISIAAVIGLPLWRKKEPSKDASLESPED